MEDTSALQDYFKKLQRALDGADLKFFSYRFVKKTRIDDLLVCTLALLPDSFKEAIKRKTDLDNLPSVTCYIRLSRILKRQIGLFPDYYFVHYASAYEMLKKIKQNIGRDIERLKDM